MYRLTSVHVLRSTLIAVMVLAAISLAVTAFHGSALTLADGFGWGKVVAPTLAYT
jgi:hypothetical protein